MLRRIILTKYGETLLPYPGTEKEIDARLETCLGIHKICNGWVDIRAVSETHKVIQCRYCALRIVIPNQVKSWKQLGQYMKQVLGEGESR